MDENQCCISLDHTPGRPAGDQRRPAWLQSSLSTPEEIFRERISRQSQQEPQDEVRDVGSFESSLHLLRQTKKAAQKLGGIISRRCIRPGWNRLSNHPDINVTKIRPSCLRIRESPYRQRSAGEAPGIQTWPPRREVSQGPTADSCFPHGFSLILPVITPHLRAYRFGTAGMLLHLVPEGELSTRCGNNTELRIK